MKSLEQIQREAREKAQDMIQFEDPQHEAEVGYWLDSIIATSYQLGKDASVDVIEQGFSESRPKTELNISELFRQARSV